MTPPAPRSSPRPRGSRRLAGRGGTLAVSALLLLALLAGLAAVLGAGGCGLGDSLRFGDLPYRLESVGRGSYEALRRSPRSGPPDVWADSDGDGLEEFFHGRDFSILGRVPSKAGLQTRWQHPLPPPFHTGRPVASLGADYDLDGDGRTEVVAIAGDSVRTRFRIWVLDAGTGDTRASLDWTPPPEDFPDGRHDVGLTPLGGIDRPDGPGQWLVVVVNGGYDHTARRILALAPQEGRVAWEHRFGPNPDPRWTRLHDVDGDGRREVIVGSAGVDNLDGVRVHGASDDSCHVHVLGPDGERRWSRALAPAPSGTRVTLADLDGDGRAELVAASAHLPSAGSRIRVWDPATGAPVAAWDAPGVVTDLATLPAGSREDALAGYQQGKVQRLRLWEGALEVVASRDLPAAHSPIAAVGDLLGDGRPEVVISLADHGVLVADAHLAPLAWVSHGDGDTHADAKIWTVAPDDPRLLLSSHPHWQFRLVRRPARWPLATAAVALVAAGGAAGLVWRRRRAGDPAVLRERRRRLLDRLQVLRHEKFGTLENLDRLLWQTEAAVAGQRPRTGPEDVIGRLVRDTRETTLVRLREAVTLARRVGVPEHHTTLLAESVDRLATLLDRYEGATTAELPHLSDRLQQARDALSLGCQRVREDAQRPDHTALPPVLAGVLRAQARALADAGVTVTAGGEVVAPLDWEPPTVPVVIMDPDDLGFLLDNLVGNALRAMAGMETRRLTLRWDAAGDRVLLEVTDTGCGIPPEDRERILAGEASTRPGGGFGLRRSQESLQRYRGKLRIARSEPGGGTTFVLELRAPDALA